MNQTIQQARKIGGSLMVRIPKDIAVQEGIREGEFLAITVKKAKKDCFGIAPTLTPFTREDRMRSKFE